MNIEETSIRGVLVLTPKRFGDDRGWFSETWSSASMVAVGLDLTFVQDNHSMSVSVGTLRGLHYQRPPFAQDKLVRCSSGAIFDVVVDIRRGSPTFGRWLGLELTAANGKQLLVPKGFLHGFVTRAANTEVQYKCTEKYMSEFDGGIRWDDPTLNIDWGLIGTPILSSKDASAPLLSDIDNPFTFEG